MAIKSRSDEPNLDDFIVSASDALVGTDQEGRILVWNQAAEDLFGFNSRTALGHLCHGILRGRDPFGNAYCAENCNILRSVRAGERIHDFELTVRCQSGEWIQTEVSIATLRRPGDEGTVILHLFRPIREAEERLTFHSSASFSADGHDHHGGHPLQPLSARELQVLQLLADGLTTAAVAAKLQIRRNTVRNHIQNAFYKLDVHSRAEAVAVALRHHLIPPVSDSTSIS